MRLLQLVLIASVLAAEEGPPATASGRRAWYSASLRSCTLGSSGVIVLVNEAAVRRRLKSTNQTVSPAAHFAAKISSRANVDRVFTLIPAIHATVSNASLEQILDDDEASTIEADCVIRLSPQVPTDEELKQAYSMRRLSVQASAPWNLDAIDGTRDSQYRYGVANGANVRIYVLDSGIRTSHNDFGGRALGGYSPYCSTGNEGYCVQNGGSWPQNGVITDATNTALGSTCSSHGTHCAGTAAGTTYGVAKAATVISVGVLDCSGDGWVSGIISGLEYVTSDVQRLGGALAVASMSLGSGPSAAEDRAVAATHAAGVAVVVAAGNENDDACNYSPSREPTAITVGSTTSTNARSSFSNYGTCVDIFAPGSVIPSLAASSDDATTYMSGTSMATPAVAGAVAQMRARNQQLTSDSAASMINCVAASNQITGLPASPASPNLLLSAGIVFSDPYHPAARRCGFSSALLPPQPPPPPPSSPSPPSPPSPPSLPPGECGETCNWSSDADCDDGGNGAEYSACPWGSDCIDCGPRYGFQPPSMPPNICVEECNWSYDGDCDDGGPGAEFSECGLGTDCYDCGRRGGPAPPPLPPLRPILPNCELLAEDNRESPAVGYCETCDACSGYCPRCDSAAPTWHLAATSGASCDDVCAAQGRTCDSTTLAFSQYVAGSGNYEELTAAAAAAGIACGSYGGVGSSYGPIFHNGNCYQSNDPRTRRCAGSVGYGWRICPCVSAVGSGMGEGF